MEDNVKKFLEAFKEALEVESREIKFEDKFREYEEWNSLARLSLIAMLDEHFGVQIQTADFDKLQTVGELFQAVQTKV